MANQTTLLAYLQDAPPPLEYIDIGQSADNTTSRSYNQEDINNVNPWPEFNVNTILREYYDLLNAVHIDYDPIRAGTPEQRAITSESGLHWIFGEYIHPRVRRSLRRTFEYLEGRHQDRQSQPQNHPATAGPALTQVLAPNQVGNPALLRTLDQVLARLPARTPVTMGVGSDASKPNQYTPDCSYFDATLPRGTIGANRLPGDFKVSRKWSCLPGARSGRSRREFQKVLAQLNYYMKQHRTPFGFILTDQQLVPVRRLNRRGDLQVADPVPWTQRGAANAPELTVALVFWYLGMLAADDRYQSFD